MKKNSILNAISCLILLTSCSELNEKDVESILRENHVYPKTVESKLFCDNDHDVARVISSGLVRDGFVTAKLKHTAADLGTPLIYFTEKANPYLLPTSDTLKSFYEQRLKIAVEHFVRITHIEMSTSGDNAVVDYLTEMKDTTPFLVLYQQDISGLQSRRIFLSKKDGRWQWDGRIIKMPGK